ncbi:MAG: DUF5680 domain-containing protein [Eubacteriales bacterium]|nr:DUF5680 domain-containing protein [Eubacteriales bacterium]
MLSQELISFLIEAKKKTYAGKGAESPSSRPCSHDLQYREGEYLYIDSYLGGESFSGEEAVWHNGMPVWTMNYSGRVTGEPFSGDFLKEALKRVPEEKPYRGPEHYEEDPWSYCCRTDGTPEWFQGYESICYQEKQVYECFFFGTVVK